MGAKCMWLRWGWLLGVVCVGVVSASLGTTAAEAAGRCGRGRGASEAPPRWRCTRAAPGRAYERQIPAAAGQAAVQHEGAHDARSQEVDTNRPPEPTVCPC